MNDDDNSRTVSAYGRARREHMKIIIIEKIQ